MNEDIKSLQACRGGDVQAFEAIVCRYQALVCAITYSAVGRRDVSEELAQETFIQAWKKLGQLKEPDKFRSWLCSIAHNMVCNYLRTQKRSPVVYGEIEDMPADGQEQSPHEVLVRQEEEEMIRTALMQIPDEYREPLVLFYRQDQSTRQVAELMGLPEATVRTRLHRGRQMLREQVESKIETTLKKTAPGAAFTRSVMGAVGVGLAAGIAANASAVITDAGTGSSASMAAAMSTLTAKIVLAAAVAVIGIGGAIAYKFHSDSQLPTEPIKQAVVLDKASLAVSIGKTTGDTVNQQLANVDNQEAAKAVSQPDTVQKEDAAKTLSEPVSQSDEKETAPVDSDNQNTNILSLKVISQVTGLAVADADITVEAYDAKKINSQGKTNSFGRYDIQHDLAKFMSLNITVTSDGCVPMKLDFRDEAGNVKLPLNYTLSLEKGTSIGGIITNEQNQPIEGASVSLLVPYDNQADQPSVRPAIWDYVIKTDAEGKWRCDIMPSKLDEIWIRLAHPDYINDNTYGATPKPSMEKLRDMTGVMVMKQGLAVWGVVMDTQGNPIAGAFVAQGSDRFGSHHPDTRTDEKGLFSFINAQPGEMILTVSAKGKSPDLKRIEVRPGLEEIKFNLESGNIIRGRVIDARGNPISGAFVAADTWRGHRSNHWRVDTDKEGRFQWNEAPADEVQFDLGKQGYMRIRREPLTPLNGEEEWELVMYRPLNVSGKVVDAKTGEDIGSFKLITGYKSNEEEDVWWNNSETKIFKAGQYQKLYSEPRYGYAIKVEAEGYLPCVSRVFKPEEEDVCIDFQLEKGDGILGFVYLPDGSPVQGAEVMLSTQGIYIQNGVFEQKREQPFCQTDSKGRFSFVSQVEDYVVAILHERGWAKIQGNEMVNGGQIVLEPWAQIKGTVYVGTKPGAGETVSIHYDSDNSGRPNVFIQCNGTADKSGHFEFNKVIAGKLQITRDIKTGTNRTSATDHERVEIAAGQSLDVQIGGKGRPVAGRLVVPAGNEKKIDFKVGWVSVSTKWDVIRPEPVYPEGFAAMSREEQSAWMEQWRESDELKAYRQDVEAAIENSRGYPVIINEDGTFKCDGVEAGHYQLRGNFTKPSNAEFFEGKAVGGIEAEFDVPEMPDGVSEEVLELGNFKVEVFTEVQIGQQAPEIKFEAIEGKAKKLSDYRGKFVLVDIWHRQAREDAKRGLEEMAGLYQQFGRDERFIMLSLTGSDSVPPVLMTQYIDHYGMAWEVGLFQDYKAIRGYGIEGYPGRFLIGPNGELLGRNLKNEELIDAIKKVFGPS